MKKLFKLINLSSIIGATVRTNEVPEELLPIAQTEATLNQELYLDQIRANISEQDESYLQNIEQIIEKLKSDTYLLGLTERLLTHSSINNAGANGINNIINDSRSSSSGSFDFDFDIDTPVFKSTLEKLRNLWNNDIYQTAFNDWRLTEDGRTALTPKYKESDNSDGGYQGEFTKYKRNWYHWKGPLPYLNSEASEEAYNEWLASIDNTWLNHPSTDQNPYGQLQELWENSPEYNSFMSEYNQSTPSKLDFAQSDYSNNYFAQNWLPTERAHNSLKTIFNNDVDVWSEKNFYYYYLKWKVAQDDAENFLNLSKNVGNNIDVYNTWIETGSSLKGLSDDFNKSSFYDEYYNNWKNENPVLFHEWATKNTSYASDGTVIIWGSDDAYMYWVDNHHKLTDSLALFKNSLTYINLRDERSFTADTHKKIFDYDYENGKNLLKLWLEIADNQSILAANSITEAQLEELVLNDEVNKDTAKNYFVEWLKSDDFRGLGLDDWQNFIGEYQDIYNNNGFIDKYIITDNDQKNWLKQNNGALRITNYNIKNLFLNEYHSENAIDCSNPTDSNNNYVRCEYEKHPWRTKLEYEQTGYKGQYGDDISHWAKTQNGINDLDQYFRLEFRKAALGIDGYNSHDDYKVTHAFYEFLRSRYSENQYTSQNFQTDNPSDYQLDLIDWAIANKSSPTSIGRQIRTVFAEQIGTDFENMADQQLPDQWVSPNSNYHGSDKFFNDLIQWLEGKRRVWSVRTILRRILKSESLSGISGHNKFIDHFYKWRKPTEDVYLESTEFAKDIDAWSINLHANNDILPIIVNIINDDQKASSENGNKAFVEKINELINVN